MEPLAKKVKTQIDAGSWRLCWNKSYEKPQRRCLDISIGTEISHVTGLNFSKGGRSVRSGSDGSIEKMNTAQVADGHSAAHAHEASLHFLDAPADPVAAHIHRIVSEAEAATAAQCMVCGGPAQLQLYEGWWATLCDRHPPVHHDDGCWRLPEADD